MTSESATPPAVAVPPPRRSLLIVVSAPSGAGKSTLCDRLLDAHDDIVYSVSCTTRAPRGLERDGVDYHFLSNAEFDRHVADGDFLEHAEVHGYRYGTLRENVHAAMARGKSILMDIDVKGAAQIRASLAGAPATDALRNAYVDIFIEPPSLDVLRRRLVGRGEDSPDVIERRMRNAVEELAAREAYRHRVVNDDLERAYREFEDIVMREQQAHASVRDRTENDASQ